ncbi:hypothetical protein CEXT_515781 [Caerostris extrusa]|uniref:Uncharacterized protein n=1 Tax=Caerostris extrusa TaxID=172846 RepID=A0AAV4N850_CAEEX|nr:hypothetical protein CEXT_515781 [Caerostris extrusa]
MSFPLRVLQDIRSYPPPEKIYIEVHKIHLLIELSSELGDDSLQIIPCIVSHFSQMHDAEKLAYLCPIASQLHGGSIFTWVSCFSFHQQELPSSTKPRRCIPLGFCSLFFKNG